MRLVRSFVLSICAMVALSAFAEVGPRKGGDRGISVLLLGIPKACTGCCSSHGGVSASCRNGRIVCNDGTVSPSCTCGSCTTTPPPPPPATCSYSYSAWSACQANNLQTRSVVGSSPFGCVGTPILSQTCTYAIPSPPTTSVNYTSLWWNPSESGWGLNVNHQDSTIFATLFTYSPTGAPMWLVASGMSLQPDGIFTGALYRISGPPFNTTPWTAVTVAQVGAITIGFTGEGAGSVTYNVGSSTVSKAIEKQIFGTPAVCVATSVSREGATNYQDLWWNPQESGWGVNLTHQGSTIFATLFTYDSAGNDLWLVASSLSKQGDGSFAGALYSTTGPAFNAAPWGTVKATEMGSMALRFTNGESATLSYTYNGVAVTKLIQRQVFGATSPMCR